jgi:hypothetical protein
MAKEHSFEKLIYRGASRLLRPGIPRPITLD